MFQKIAVPVDLAHAGAMARAVQAAARIGGAEVVFVGVTTTQPNAVARTPQEFSAKLDSFAAQQAQTHGLTASTHVITSHDPSIQMDKELERAVADMGADLVVMASHVPNVTDYIWAGHGAHMAAHSAASVLLVREASQ